MRKIAVLLFVIVFIMSVPFHAGAAHIVGLEYGDVNRDFTVDITDTAQIQRALIMAQTFDEVQTEAADYDHDGSVTAVDVTFIQRRLAKMAVPEGLGGRFEYHSCLRQVFADYESGKAMAGVPVTFTAQGGYGEYDSQPNSLFDPVSYRFEVYEIDAGHNPVLIAEQDFSADNTFTYTFENADAYYNIKVSTRDRFRFESTILLREYHVVQPYSTEKPIVTSVYTDKYGNIADGYLTKYPTSCRWDDMTVSAVAKGGRGDYMFAFELNTKEETITQDYSADNRFLIDKANFPGWEEYAETNRRPSFWNVYKSDNVAPYELTIRVKDSEGNESSETVEIGAIYDFNLMD